MLLVGHTVYMIMKNYYSILHLFTFHHHIISYLVSNPIAYPSIHPSIYPWPFAVVQSLFIEDIDALLLSPCLAEPIFHFQYVHTRYPQSRLAHRNPCDIHDSALFVSVIVPAGL